MAVFFLFFYFSFAFFSNSSIFFFHDLFLSHFRLLRMSVLTMINRSRGGGGTKKGSRKRGGRKGKREKEVGVEVEDEVEKGTSPSTTAAGSLFLQQQQKKTPRLFASVARFFFLLETERRVLGL